MNTYSENASVQGKIDLIIDSSESRKKKMKLLKELKAPCHSPLVISHIEYYEKQLKNTGTMAMKKAIFTVIMILYGLFNAYRIFLYYNPQYNPFNSRVSVTLGVSIYSLIRSDINSILVRYG